MSKDIGFSGVVAGGAGGAQAPPAVWEDGGAEGAKRFEGAPNARKLGSH